MEETYKAALETISEICTRSFGCSKQDAHRYLKKIRLLSDFVLGNIPEKIRNERG